VRLRIGGIGIARIPLHRRIDMNARFRICIAIVAAMSALAMVLPAASVAYMTLPPVKIAPPSHADPAPPDPMTKDWILTHGGSCPFAGGGCVDKDGHFWDCSDANHCVRPE
jgi:hypothetical protein